MLDKLKEYLSKFKGYIVAAAAGLAVVFLLFKRSDGEGIGEYLKKVNTADDDRKKIISITNNTLNQLNKYYNDYTKILITKETINNNIKDNLNIIKNILSLLF